MIFALVGPSACGKTTHAQLAAEKLAVPVRHCGNEVREAAAAKGCSISTCDDDIHKQVDQQTIDWCEGLGDTIGVVEGRFLDQVLSGLPNIVFIQIAASDEQRAERLSERRGCMITEADVRAIDHEDDMFRQRMYSAAPIAPKAYVIDTSGGTAPECVQNLISLMGSLTNPQPD
jgi:cytidylate kinase